MDIRCNKENARRTRLPRPQGIKKRNCYLASSSDHSLVVQRKAVFLEVFARFLCPKILATCRIPNNTIEPTNRRAIVIGMKAQIIHSAFKVKSERQVFAPKITSECENPCMEHEQVSDLCTLSTLSLEIHIKYNK